jgi:uncharacterized protein (DUF1778 family)
MQKAKQLKVRLSESQHSEIKESAENLGVSISTYVLNRCLNLKFKAKDIPSRVVKKETKIVYSDVAQSDPKLIFEVAKIGNNINQLARKINQHDDSMQASELLIALQSISESLRELTNVK